MILVQLIILLVAMNTNSKISSLHTSSMLSRCVCCHFIILKLILLLTLLCFDLVSCKKEFMPNNVKQFVNNSFIVHNKTSLVDRTFTFSNITSSKASIHSNLDASIKAFYQNTGYYHIKNSYDARMFYFFYESRGSKTDPIVLYLTGGPGGSSLVDIFLGAGPFRINDDLSLRWNNFGWDKVSNLLYVDQPIGTGFSYSSDTRDIRHNTKENVDDLYNFLQAFFQDHLELVKNDFYIAGTSFSGHTIPVLASRLIKENYDKKGIHINLKGFAIGNGFTDPKFKFSSDSDFALMNKLIRKSFYYQLKRLNTNCVKSIHHCQIDDNRCQDSKNICEYNFWILHHTVGDINLRDIRMKATDLSPVEMSRITNLLALNSVRMALKVGNKQYFLLNIDIMKAMTNDTMKNYATLIPSLLENGIKVMIFDGEYDMMCNWLGNVRWLNSMKWSGWAPFFKSKLIPYIVDGKMAGKIKRVGPLTYIKVHNAGHDVSTDQPKVALEILKKLIKA